ncbi:hypothetical protein Tco_0987784 [Tanacetum coccineum]
MSGSAENQNKNKFYQRSSQVRTTVALNQEVEEGEQQERVPPRRKKPPARRRPLQYSWMIAEPQTGPIPNEPSKEKGIKVAIHPEHPEQTVTIGGILGPKIHGGTLVEYLRGMSLDKAKEERSSLGQKQSHPGRSHKVGRSTNHERSTLSQLVSHPAKAESRGITR